MGDLATLADRFRIEATDRGVSRLRFGRGQDAAPPAGRRHVEHARAQLAEYLGGRRTFFTVPLDLGDLPDFQAQVLELVLAVPFGQRTSYAHIAQRIGHPRAARAVGNAVATNPVPILVPCHRVVRLDGTWGHYAFGGDLKTSLLRLEETTPALVGSVATRTVCRRGCERARTLVEPDSVVFVSLDDAVNAGYRRCPTCQPAEAPDA
jgi:O-6-methylguanine DNA methyltransferase